MAEANNGDRKRHGENDGEEQERQGRKRRKGKLKLTDKDNTDMSQTKNNRVVNYL